MPVIDQQRISDGFLTLERGIDAGKSPNLLPRNQASLAVNATMRGGYVKTRPGFENIPLVFTANCKWKAEEMQENFKTGTYHGAYNYNFGKNNYLICAIGGRVYKINPRVQPIQKKQSDTNLNAEKNLGAEVQDITPTKNQNYNIALNNSAGYITEFTDATCDINSNTTVTCDSSSKIAVGQSVSGYGIEAGTFITAVNSAGSVTSFTINQAATQTGSNIDSLTFATSYPAGSPSAGMGAGVTITALPVSLVVGDQIKFANGGLFTLSTNAAKDATTVYGSLTGANIVNDELGTISIKIADKNPSDIPVYYFQQAEQYLIIQDGRSLPIIFNGAVSRRSDVRNNEVPVGQAMAYGNGRLWVSKGREFVAGDIVGGPTSVIQFTENTYIAEGGAFAVPLNTGDITAMKFMNQPDSSLGQGELLVHTDKAVFAVNVPTSRDDWKKTSYPTVRIVAINYGAVSDRSCSLVNGDMFYRATDGVRSYVSSRREWKEYGQIPISREIGPLIVNEQKRNISGISSSVLFDNRLLTTINPDTNSSQGTFFKGLAVLDFDLVGGNGQKSPAAWEGIWTGLNFLEIIEAEIDKESRCFIFALDGNCRIQLWDLTKNGKGDVTYGTDGDGKLVSSRNRIQCYVETSSYSFENPFELKKLEYGEMWVDELEGEVDFDIKYKPNQYPAWVNWSEFSECAKIETCGTNTTCTLNNYKPQYRTRRRLSQPSDDCESTNGAPMRNGYELAVRIGWTGQARLKGFRLHAYPVIEEPYGDCPEFGNCT
jgi:hypothetical protein